ncbi:glutathione S-transferase N-terminal domain-containing protein [Govanella unica]|uniref:Glutathione S-transferase N-terminal domain-containing protein n=1 Tax=Govanella unica TaxID=2975056 RepID=A0A9X3TY97_9PROT|nr:glutathione S-transferase N-terminal domain-containing protein [Govania unica]MDA5194165.1 glutathione S-transferase N-terminal domain-containing protein [Govania unica]
MIDLYYWPTPNGWKISIMLEECGLPYTMIPVNIGAGDQFKPDFLKISPNNRMPAIVDHEAVGGPLSIFESGAILTYLAEKTGRFLPTETRARFDVLQWLFWQVGGLGPMAGQLGHFKNYAADPIPYAIQRYENEYNRLLGVMDHRLADREFLAGDYSIADMASWPWVRSHERLGQALDEFKHLKRWFDGIAAREPVQKAIEVGKDLRRSAMTDEEKKILFGQTAASVTPKA